MNRFRKVIVVSLSLFVLFGVFSVGESKAQGGTVGEVLKRMEDHYKGLTTLKASVKMDKLNSQLGEHDISEGNLTLITQKGRDAAFRIDWTKPANESLAVVNKQYVLYRESLKTAYVGSVNSVKGGQANGLNFLNMSKADLKAHYDISYVGQESVGATPTWHLVLVPKTKVNYKNADIWVDGNGMPIQIKQTENNSDTTTIVLSGLNKNVTVNAKELQISWPKVTKIIKS